MELKGPSSHEEGPKRAPQQQATGEAGGSIPIPTPIPIPPSIPIPVSAPPPTALDLPGADSPPHISISSLPKPSKFCCSTAALQQQNRVPTIQAHIYIYIYIYIICCCCCCCCCAGEAPLGKGRGAALLPGRRRILRAAAKQLAAVELLQEQLDVSAVDIDTHCMPPPDAAADSSGSHPLQQQQQQQQQGSEAPTCSSQSRSLELLRLHALLQAAVGTEQDLVVVG